MTTQAPHSSQTERITVALIGNPNTGKSTLFNALTGVRQKVGNYPGVTVDRRFGICAFTHDKISRQFEIIDLPGTYSLVARSIDEAITVDVLADWSSAEKKIDHVLLVLDESNLERNLYLASQVLEFGIPTTIALTMCDVAKRRGAQTDLKKLSELLGCQCVHVHAPSGKGMDTLKQALLETTPPPLPAVPYPGKMRVQVEELAVALSSILRAQGEDIGGSLSFQEALRAISDPGASGESRVVSRLGESARPLIEQARSRLEIDELSPHMAEAGARTQWSRSIAAQCVELAPPSGETWTDRFDRILTHRLWGTLIFLAIMGLVFQSIYSWASPLMDLISEFFDTIGASLAGSIENETLASLLVDGVIAGVGGVLVFLPQIAILFLFLAVLESSGYLSRAAFLMDRWLRKVGLTGRSFIPLMSGFACAVPAVMATRTIPDRSSRFVTMLVTPLTTCSARLPVYALLIGAFVPANLEVLGISAQALSLLGMYLFGILVVVPIAFVFRKTLFRGLSAPLMIELPTYRLPQVGTVIRRSASSSWSFIKNAGSIIFVTSIVIWALNYYPRSDEITASFETERSEAVKHDASDDELAAIDARLQAAQSESSYLGQAGKVIEPVVEPLGWDWRIGSAAIASFPAREVVVGAMGVLFSAGSDAADDEEYVSLSRALQQATRSDGSKLFSLATALSIMVFFALCMQCAATLGAIKRETKSWTWPAFSFVYMTLLAYLGSLVTYNIAVALGAGG